VKLDRLDALANDELRRLLAQSYEIVQAKRAAVRKKLAGSGKRGMKSEPAGSAVRKMSSKKKR
jgi:hypothetical protein